jgi:hypothetical protein
VNRPGFVRRHISPATVIASIALFTALGGSSYAVLKINGSQINNRSISGKKLKRNTLGGVTIKESRLGKVRRARRADRLGRFSSADLRLHCPPSTTLVSGVCAERSTRPATAYGFARIECDAAGRRLPTYEELSTLVSGADISVAPPEELTSSVYLSGPTLRIVTVKDEAGTAGSVTDTGPQGRPFRCVAYPSN